MAGRMSLPVNPKGSRIEIYEVDPLNDPRWPVFVQSHPKSSVFHSLCWLRALRNVYGYETVAVTTCPPSARLTNGLVFCRIHSWLTGKRLVSLPFSDHCDPLFDRLHELDSALSYLRQQVDRRTWQHLEIRPLFPRPNGYSAMGRGCTYQVHCLDLRPSIGELLQGFHRSCVQRKIRRAEREKLQYEEGLSEDLLQRFYRLLVMTRRRQHLPPQPLNWFRGLIDSFGKDLQIRVASKDGVPVASIITLFHKKSVIYKYGCSNAVLNKLGGTALLFWKTIQDAKCGGLEELEMGRSEMDNVGLIGFKERWGASQTPVSYWNYPAGRESVPAVWQKKLSRYVVSTVPGWMLEGVGRVLYIHLG
jgi:hypothetical protein